MNFFENKIPSYLTDKKNTVRQLLFTSLFALVFINLYSPFGVGTWTGPTQIHLLVYSSGLILAGLLVIALSRIIMHQVTRKRTLTNLGYMAWIAMEILSLSVVYVILQHFIIEKTDNIINALEESLKKTALVLLLPYTISYLYFSWVQKNSELERLSRSKNGEKPLSPSMIPFRDEKGELRFSVKKADLLYLEAADNYVIINYLDGKEQQKFMIRNSMKSLEDNFKSMGIVRCHRSYCVNLDRVKIVRKEADGLVLELDSPLKKSIPISQTYVEQVMVMFSGLSGDHHAQV